MKRPLAYITAAWSGDQAEDSKRAVGYCRAVYEAGFSPLCPALYLPLVLNDAIPEEHKSGIDISRDLLRRALAGLSEEDRELFLRRYYYNQTAEQIAQEKHMNANTVRSRLARGRQALKAELQKGAIQIEDLCAESV